MGRGSSEVRRRVPSRSGVLALAIVLGAGVTGCQPLYGGKPDKLPTPQRRKAPPTETVVDIPVKEIDDCQADFRADPKRVTPNSRIAKDLTADGVSTIIASDKIADPMAQANKLREGIDKFRNALIKDPYYIEATLQLALAYDRVYRKGCAIAMLKRLATLSAHPDFARQANAAIDSISDNGQWFKRYRKDAMTAAGR
jgi:hypothetical protein